MDQAENQLPPDTQNPSRNEEMERNIAINSTKFAIKLNKLFYEKSQKDGNVLFSPINIYSALALVHLGSDSQTRSEIADLMGFSKIDNEVQQSHESLSQIMKAIKTTNTAYVYEPDIGGRDVQTTKINIAEGIFIQKGVNLKDSYVSQARTFYGGEVSNLDFANESNEATETINQYISGNTEGRIPQLYSEPLQSNTTIILACVLHFKAKWNTPFPKHATYSDKFNTGSEEIVVQMMSYREDMPYINLPSLKSQAVELIYTGYDVSMCIILPNIDQSLENVVKLLDYDILQNIVQESTENNISCKIPKTKYKWTENIVDYLQTLGALEMFTNKADLSNLLENMKLKISEITHATQIEIDEEGTEASAVTIVKLIPMCARMYSRTIDFIVNRPFIFFIRHRATNTILFLGSVKNPNGNL